MDDETLRELFASLGRVTIRAMFGGKGIYSDGIIIAAVVDGELLLKADAESAPLFRAADARQWTYTRPGRTKQVAMPYWSVPEGALDDAEQMELWARRAWEAADRQRRRLDRAEMPRTGA